MPHGRRDAFFESFLAGYGAVFFAPSARSGALFLCGAFAASPGVAVPAMVGLFAATATVRALRRPSAEAETGLGGYHGALVGYFLLAAPLDAAFHPLAVMAASAVAVWIAALLTDGPWRNRLNLPCVSLPALLAAYPTIWLYGRLTGSSPPSDLLFPPYLTRHDLFRPEFFDAEFARVGDLGAATWARAALYVAGFLAYSPRLLALVVGGAAVGAAVGYAGLGWYGALNASFTLYCAVPTFVGLAGFFTSGGLRAVVFGASGVVVAFALWFGLGVVWGPLGVPLLTTPQALATLGLLLALRALGPRAPRWFPRHVPLGRALDPDAAARWAREAEEGAKYWEGVGALVDRPWTAFARPARMRAAQALVRRSHRIVVLSGAGLSTESGIPDYRTGTVAWKKYDVSHFRFERFVASEESRRKYWEMSQDFYLLLRTAEPNAAHRAVAELHRRGKLACVVTQNVDRLHQRAGAPDERVVELHGNEFGVACLNCGLRTSRDEVYGRIVAGVDVPHCTACQGLLKPESTAFGEPMPEGPSLRALEAVRGADLVIVVGTSLSVQPAASLPLVALRKGTPLIIVNLDPTDLDPFADVVLRGPAGVLLPQAVETR